MAKLSVSIGIFAHNESRNLPKLLSSIEKQKLGTAVIKEILVVSSGSYDRTNELIREYSKKDKRVKLIEQIRREGKSSAINLFLNQSKSDILIAISGDLRLHTRAIEEITLPFLNTSVGMAGAHPIPLNIQHNPLGQQVRLLWLLHHLMALQNPKCGEMVAFRKVIKSIPAKSAVDEANLEVLMHLIGFKIVYAPRSIVYNRGPATFNDFIKQRRRVYVGHQWVAQKYHYQVSTMQTSSTFKTVRNYVLQNPSELRPMLKLLTLEFYSRILGWIDFNIFNKNPYVWEMVER